MIRSRSFTAALATLSMILSVAVWAGPWSVVGSNGSPLATQASAAGFDLNGAQGLQCPASQLPDKPAVHLRFLATHTKGSGPLLVGSCPADAVASLSLPEKPTASEVDLWLGKPAGAGVYIGGVAGNVWHISEPTIAAWNPPHPETLGKPCTVPQPLPAGWKPGGVLDARTIKVGTEQRLQADAGSINVILSPEATVYRGVRDEEKADAFNSSDEQLELTCTLHGPPCVWLPPVHWPIPARTTFTIRPEFTSFWAGNIWTKLVLSTNGQECSVPVRINVKPAYPAFGVFLSASATPADLAAALTQPVSVVAAPASLWLKAGAHHLGPEGFAYGSEADLAALAASPSAAWVRIACLWGPASGWQAAIKSLSANEAVKKAKWLLAAGPVRTTEGPKGLSANEADVAALKTCWKSLSCIAMSPPRVPAVAVASVRAAGEDEKAPTAWAVLDRTFNALAVRRQLAAAGIALPIAWTDLATGDGSPTARADMSVWARAATSLLYAGSTGIFARWTPAAGTPEWLGLMRELSSATPLVSPSETPFAAVAPGGKIVYRLFLRGNEGTLVLSNSSRRILTLQSEVRAQPLLANDLRFAPGVAPVRTCEIPYRFAPDALAQGRSLVFTRLLPGETALINLRLSDPSPTWLRIVQEKVVHTTRGAPQQATGHNDTWWTDQLGKETPAQRQQ